MTATNVRRHSIAILGAGAMGSALATPLAAAGHDVRLWGTHLDDHLIAAVRRGDPHPRTKVPLADGVATFTHDQFDQAVDGADIGVIAVSSVGLEPITRLAAEKLAGMTAVFMVTKGFAVNESGGIDLLPQTIERIVEEVAGHCPPVVAIGGPCKANEIAASKPTAAIWSCRTEPERWAAACETDVYRLEATTDVDGVELCAALKNVYAIGLGIADGLTEVSSVPRHDLKAAIFARAIIELRRLLSVVGADPWTAGGLAGAGDLEVTGLSGRNKLYGVRLGKGQPAKEALAEMEAAEQTVEGVPAVALAMDYLNAQDSPAAENYRLVAAINDIVHHDAPISTIVDAALPARWGTR